MTEGLSGAGDAFMQGTASPERLPNSIVRDVARLHHAASDLGPVRFEWVHDGQQAWIVQLHRGATGSSAEVLVEGDAADWVAFDVKKGLESLRELLTQVHSSQGVQLVGKVGLTSHIADVIRKAGVPARMQDNRTSQAA